MCSSFAYGQCDLSCAEIKNCINAKYINSVIEEPAENLDNDPTNELQTISISGDVITLSDGGGSVTITHPTQPCPTFTNLEDPVLTYTGTLNLQSEQVLEVDRYVVENFQCVKKDVQEFQFRINVRQLATNGWAIIRVPNIGGYDRRVFDIGTYRSVGNLNNPDNGNNITTGAMPDAPYMGKEAHEWSNSGLIYLNQFNDKDNDATMWVEFIAQYRGN